MSGIIENGGLLGAEYVLNRLYMASQRPDIRTLMSMKSRAERRAEAERLLALPDPPLIDREIMVEGGTGGEPLTCIYGVMLNRINDGFYWQKALNPGELDALPQEEDYKPYQQPSPQPPRSLRVTVRPQEYVQAQDVTAVPRPFSQWRESGPADGGIGTVYMANSQEDDGVYGQTWPDPSTGAIYEKFFIAAWGLKIVKWKRIK